MLKMPKRKKKPIKMKNLPSRYTSYLKDRLTKRIYKGVIDEYSKFAYIYEDRWKDYLTSTENALLEQLKKLKLKGRETILDAGCGTGSLLYALRTKLKHKGPVVGFDITPAMLDLAEAKLASQKKFIKNLQLELAHCENFSAKPNSIDVILCSSVLHHLPHPEKALHQFHRVLRKKGRLLLLDICTDYPTTRLFDLFSRLFRKAHHRAYTSAEADAMLKKNKFKIVSFKTWKASSLFGVMLFEAKKK